MRDFALFLYSRAASIAARKTLKLYIMKKNSPFFLCILFVFAATFAKAQIGTNIDFGAGTISGWNYDEGINANSITMATVSGFSTSTAYSVMAPGSTEAVSIPITMTSPLGGNFVRVGRPTTGGYVGRLSQTFTVPSGTTSLNVAYAMVLENAAHACTDNPYFYIALKDASGNVIPGTSVNTSNSSSCSSYDPSLSTSGSYSYKNWTTMSYNLASYVGTSVTLEVYGSGCVQTGHLGYCYFDAQSCSSSSTSTMVVNGVNYPLNSAQNYLSICGSNTATVTAPAGATSYSWSGSGISGLTTQSVSITQAGVYGMVCNLPSGCSPTTAVTFTIGTNPTVFISGPDSLCLAPSVTFTATGTGNTYAWSSSGGFISSSSGTGPSYSVNLSSPAPYTFTVNCVATGTNGCMSMATKQVKVLGLPTLSVASSSVGCSGSPVTLTASGATSYTWSANAGGVNTASTVVTPTSTTQYTVSGTGANGCSSSTTTTVVINTTTLAVNPTAATICPGYSLTLSASGANTYTWSTGANTASIIVTPTVTTTYTVGGTSGCGTFTNSIQITVYTSPTVAISGPDSLCLTSSVTFTAAGNGLSYSWSATGVSTSSGSGPTYAVNLSGPAPYTFTVNCTTTNGCTNVTATKQVKVLAYPFISVSGPTVVCQYSSGTLIASGANSYTWSTGANTASINVTPTVTTSYTVIGESSGCTSNIDTVQLAVDNTCQDVWPGDANSDGTADNTDVLELGLHYTQTGPARASVSNSWQSYYAADWSGTITNGQNLNHSDCNGDGVIDANDTLAIYNNYGLTHAFKQAQITSNAQLTIVPDQASLNAGDWGSASIFLGEAGSPVNNVNGVAFTVSFDQSMIATGNAYLEYPVSFINAANHNLHFRKPDFSNGMIYTATTHTLSNNVSGNGKIAVLHFRVDPSSQAGVLNLGLSQGSQSSANGAITSLTTGNATLAISGTPTAGVNELIENSQIAVYPNPATEAVNINSSLMLQKVELLSLTGQVVLSQPVSGRQCQMKLPGVEEGIYFVNVYSNGHIVKREKIVVQK